MADNAHTTPACPRLTSGAARITSAELLTLLDPPGTKRRGTIRALVVRHFPRLASADLGLSHAIV